jgi:hypothetical protein
MFTRCSAGVRGWVSTQADALVTLALLLNRAAMAVNVAGALSVNG